MIGSRVESGLELRFLELERHQALGSEPGWDQRGRHLLRSRFSKVAFVHKEGLQIS